MIKTVLRKIRILFTEHQSVVTKEHLHFLIEKYAGAFPVWLAPVQIKLLPIADRHLDYVYEIKKQLEANGILRVEVDDRSEKLGYKLREAQLEKYLICLLSVIRILKITLYLFVQEKRATRVLWQ